MFPSSTRNFALSPSVPDFEALVSELSADENVVGLLLAGSRGRGALVRDESDYDLYVFLRERSLLEAYAARYPTRHGDSIEVILRSREGFAKEPSWNRYTFCHVEPLFDRSSGWLGETLTAITTVDTTVAGELLDGYINSYYRSLKGTDELGKLFDAAESVSHFLDFVFAVHGRVRPFNKWLSWELTNHPLQWNDLGLLERIIRTGDLAEQAALFQEAESIARAHGLAEVVDGWEPDVERLRVGV